MGTSWSFARHLLAYVGAAAASALAVWAVVILAEADLASVFSRPADWSYFLAALPTYAVVVLCRGGRLRLMLAPDQRASSRPSLLLLAGVSALHVLASNVLPFRTGEVVLPVLLKRRGLAGLVRGTGILAATRLLDFLVLFLAMAAAGALAAPEMLGRIWWWLAAGLAVCLVGAGLLGPVLLRGNLRRGRDAAPRTDPSSTEAAGEEEHGFYHGASARRTTRPVSILARGFLWSVALWAGLFVVFHLLLKWAGCEGLTLAQSVVGSAGAIVAQFLPINTLLALGTVEAGWAAGLYLGGIDPALGVTVGFRMHFAILLFNLLAALVAMAALRRVSSGPRNPESL
jgi:hypothetical protein